MLIAIALLCRELAHGPTPAARVTSQAATAGIRPSTLRRARERLGVQVRQEGRAWLWELARAGTVPTTDAMLGLSQRPLGTIAEVPVGTTVQLASGAWARVVAHSPCQVTITEPGRNQRQVTPGTEVFAMRADTSPEDPEA